MPFKYSKVVFVIEAGESFSKCSANGGTMMPLLGQAGQAAVVLIKLKPESICFYIITLSLQLSTHHNRSPTRILVLLEVFSIEGSFSSPLYSITCPSGIVGFQYISIFTIKSTKSACIRNKLLKAN